MSMRLARWPIVLIAGLVVSGGLTSVDALTLPQTKNWCAAGTYWLSLPTRTDLRKAEDLCALIPNSTTVARRFPDGSGAWTWTCGGTSSASCSSTPQPGTCGSNCFCIGSGEGYQVTISAASTFEVRGCEEQIPITVPSLAIGGTQLFSFPYDTTLTTCESLVTLLNLDAAGITRGGVVGQVGCPPVLVSSSAGTTQCSATPIIPGEAYLIRQGDVPSVASFINPTIGLNNLNDCPTVQQNGNKYCVVGTSSGTDYSWGYDLDGTVGFGGACEASVSSVSAQPLVGLTNPGDSAIALVANFVKSLNAAATCTNISASQFSGNFSYCFKLMKNGGGPGQPVLYVGPGGATNPNDYTLVGSTPVAYNPIIYQVDESQVPTLGAWGIGALVILMILAGTYLLRRRAWVGSGLQ